MSNKRNEASLIMHKTNKKRRHGELYIRYLLSYALILLIPLLILTFFYSSRFMKKFYEEIYETVDLELVQVSTQIENEIKSMQSIVGQLTLTNTVQKVSSAANPLQLNSFITYLSGYCSANSFIEDIALICDKQNYVITSTTTTKKNAYLKRAFQISEQNADNIQNIIQSSSKPLCIPLEKVMISNYNVPESNAVVFTFPLFTDFQKREGTALFYVKVHSMEKMLSQKLKSYQTQVFAKNTDGVIITLSDKNQTIDTNIKKYLNSDISAQEQFEDKSYLMRSYYPDNSSWSYYAFIPNKQTTFSQVTDIMKEFMLTILIILLLAILAIIILQKINYTPMKRLRDKAASLSANNSSSDELADISHALDYLSLQNRSLSTKLADNFTAIKNDRLYRLVSGSYSSKEDFNLDCSELDLSLEHNYYSTSIIMLHSSVKNINELAQDIKKQLQLPYVYYYLHNFYSNQIILLFNLPTQNATPAELMYKTLKYLQTTYNLLSTAGIGSVVNSTDRIPQSYIEAVSALDYRFVKGNGTIIEFKEALNTKTAKSVYPHQEFEALKNSLLTQNEKNIRDAIQNIIQFMESNQLPLYHARSICFDLKHIVNEHCHNLKNDDAKSPLEISGIETAQEIIDILRNWSVNLSNLAGIITKKAVLEDVINFVKDNCLRCDFSAFEAAEYFEMTLPAFSKYFKDQTGQNVMDYTIQLRIQKAKELLETTDLPLKEIGETVGYYNISSFTRRFKINQGIAPSEYRKITANKL